MTDVGEGYQLREVAFDPLLPFAKGNNRPIPLKKSDVISTVERYASEIEILTIGRRYRA